MLIQWTSALVTHYTKKLGCNKVITKLFSLLLTWAFHYPTNIGIVRGTVSVATIVVVNAGVEIWLL